MTRKSDVGRARLEDVARLARVSTSTASKVLNDVPNVSVRPETRQRVLAAASTLGYQPHVLARALAGVPARALALLVPELTNPVYSQMIRGAFAQAQTRGYTVLVAEDYEDQDVEAGVSSLVAAGRVDGVLVGSARQKHPLVARFAEQRVPHVFINRPVTGSRRNVTVRMADAIVLAVEHLAGLGHSAVGFVGGPEDISSARIRADTFLIAARRLGVDDCLVVHAEFDEEGGARGVGELVARNAALSAVLCNSLSQAVGAMHALHSRGLRIPRDVSVMAYDDLPLAGFLSPPLDTIAMPLGLMGRLAVDALLDQIHGAEPRDIVVPDPPQLVLRGSTCPAGNAARHQ